MLQALTPAQALDRESPSAARAGLGTLLSQLTDAANALRLDAILRAPSINRLLGSPVLAIKAAESPTAKTSGAFSAMVGGYQVAVAADTDMPAIAGTLADTKYALWAFYVDRYGTLTVSTKTADQSTSAAALAAKPAVPDNTLEIGYLIVQNAQGGAAAFTAGTTALDATGITSTFTNTSVWHPLITAPALAITAASGKTGKTLSTFTALVKGEVVTVAAETSLAAIAGTLATTKYALWSFYVDVDGTLTTATKTADQTTAAAALAAKATVPANKCEIGWLIVHNAQAASASFVGGTTALDATGVTATFYEAPALTLSAGAIADWNV
jgi:hypothetical protein